MWSRLDWTRPVQSIPDPGLDWFGLVWCEMMWKQMVLVQPNPLQYNPIRCNALFGLDWSNPTLMRGELDWAGPIQVNSVLSCPTELASE
eukprot:2861562-Lingulodinium_polyedra.AAC.1